MIAIDLANHARCPMDSTSKNERPSDRRAAERRVKQQRVYPGGEKRTAARRSGSDRRNSPRD